MFSGSETFLLATLRAGGAGCISATANVNPAAIAKLHREWRQPDADARQAALDHVRAAFQKYPMIPALKAAVAHYSGDGAWPTVRPPLVALTAERWGQLLETLNGLKFAMPGLRPAGADGARSPPAAMRSPRRLVLVGGGHSHVEVLRGSGPPRSPGRNSCW